MAFPNAEGQGGIQAGHLCDPAKAAAVSGLVDRSRVFRSLQDKLPSQFMDREQYPSCSVKVIEP